MIEVDVVTPTRRLIVGAKASSLTLPASDGQIEVLPGHTELLTLLGTGELKFSNGTSSKSFAVSYGFAEVRADKVIILAENAEEASEIDLKRAQLAQKKAEAAMAASVTPADFRKFQLKLQRALIRQQVASSAGTGR